MTRIGKSMAGAAGLAMLALFPAAGLAGTDHSPISGDATERSATGELRLAHMRGPAGGPGMMGPGMLGGRMMGPGLYGVPDDDDRVVLSRDLTVDDVRHFLEHRLEMRGNKRLKLGDVTSADEDMIVAEITTVDGSLVERLEVDRHTGEIHAVE